MFMVCMKFFMTFFKAVNIPGQNDTFAPVVLQVPGHMPLVPKEVGACASYCAVATSQTQPTASVVKHLNFWCLTIATLIVDV